METKDFKIVYYKRFKGIVFESTDEQIFASIYYEQGHYQGDVIFELTDEEKANFKNDNDAFLNTCSDLVLQSFQRFKKERHLDDFRKKVNTGELVRAWNEKN